MKKEAARTDQIRHFVITRFCLSANDDYEKSIRVIKDRFIRNALDPGHLEQRMVLLENIAFPSLINQTCKNFVWVILIDPALPKKYKNRLEILAESINLLVVPFNSNLAIWENDWLRKFDKLEYKYLITSMLDDDDAYQENFISDIQNEYLPSFIEHGLLLLILGSSHAIQWDMLFSWKNAWGLKSDWHRKSIRALSCGLTLISEYSKNHLSVMSLQHVFTYLHFSADYPIDGVKIANVDWVRDELQKVFGSDLQSMFGNEMRFVDTHPDMEPPLLTNHFRNVQPRLREKKGNSAPVASRKDFEKYHIDWDGIKENRYLFKPALKSYIISSIAPMKKRLQLTSKKSLRFLKEKWSESLG